LLPFAPEAVEPALEDQAVTPPVYQLSDPLSTFSAAVTVALLFTPSAGLVMVVFGAGVGVLPPPPGLFDGGVIVGPPPPPPPPLQAVRATNAVMRSRDGIDRKLFMT